MSENINHEYFNRKYSEWSITGFLNECNKEPFRLKIDDYLKSLQVVISNDQGKRREKAQQLYDKYKKATSSPFKSISRATKP
ncbi:10215_t:CDS:2, partial [Dentiscutata erythropus]